MKKIEFLCVMLILMPISLSARAKSFLFQPDGANFFVYGRGSRQFVINQSRFTEFDINAKIRQLASGKRIVSAADDPSGLAVAEKMNALIQGMQREVMNDEDMKNYYAVVESAIAEDNNLLRRIALLIQKSAGVISGPEEREITQVEIDQLLEQINMNARFSQFNTKKIIPELTASNLGIDRVNVVRNQEASGDLVEAAMTKLVKLRTYFGARSNILEFRIKGKTMYYINQMEAESRIRDLDMAEGISDLMKHSVMLKTQYGILLREK